MNKEFFDVIDILEKEKGISKEYLIEKVEIALQKAYYAEHKSTNARVLIDKEKKEVRVFQQKTVVENVEDENTEISLEDAKKISKRNKIGDIVEFEIKTKSFQRTGVTNAKQIIIQGIREAEQGNLIKEYESKKEEIITATVLKIDSVTGNIIVDTGTSIATILKSEQIPGEKYFEGQKIKVYVVEIKKDQRGPIVNLSRTHPGLIKRLFELEVPEIQDGTVQIMSVAREAGSRSKIAVYSSDENVDAVGSCIGQKSMRINNVTDEVNGEKIDIIKYSNSTEEFVSSALAPANVLKVEMDSEKSCVAYVEPDQLSLAIGKDGQNVRLAAKLTTIKIDIHTNET